MGGGMGGGGGFLRSCSSSVEERTMNAAADLWLAVAFLLLIWLLTQ
jgi:hypothetical protein